MEPTTTDPNNLPPTSIEYALHEVSTHPYTVSQLPIDDVNDSELKMSLKYSILVYIIFAFTYIWMVASMWRCRKDMPRFVLVTRMILLSILFQISFFI